jgi:hypothetical protein
MPPTLLKLGRFSFTGLESPERIHLQAKQRLAIHHLGSGQSTADCLGEDAKIATFRGIFSGINAAERARSINYLRDEGLPLMLEWGTESLLVIIQKLELDYSSALWVPYQLSCYVVQWTETNVEVEADIISETPIAQVGDLLGLMQNSSVSPTSDQCSALIALTTRNYDQPSADALARTEQLVSLIDDQLATLADAPFDIVRLPYALPPDGADWIDQIVANSGQQAGLILARNRVMNIVVRANGSDQQ